MPTPEQIRKKFEEMAKGHGPAVSNIAKVKSVDENNGTCVLVDEDGQEIFDVRLRPVLSENKSFILVPKVESYVLAVRVEDDDDWMVIAADEITKFGYYVGDNIFEMDSTGFHFKKQEETFKKILVDLVTAVKSLELTVSTTGSATAQTGQTTSIVNLAEFEAIETRINQFLN